MSEENGRILSPTEVGWIITSFLMHPDRLEKGAPKEEIIKIIEWAQELKTVTMVNLGILYGIYDGTIAIDYREDDVYLSLSPRVPPDARNPEQYLNVNDLIK